LLGNRLASHWRRSFVHCKTLTLEKVELKTFVSVKHFNQTNEG